MRRLRAWVERLLSPGYGCCYRCRRPWTFVPHHDTQYTLSNGCFPLCEACWQELGSAAARMPYYRALWEHWLATSPDPEWRRETAAKWPEIANAVQLEAAGLHVSGLPLAMIQP